MTGRRPAVILAVIVGAMALLNLVNAVTPTLLGRDFNLFWDLRHLPSLFGLASGAAGIWQVASVFAVVIAAMLLLTAAAYWVWRNVIAGLAHRRIAPGAANPPVRALDVSAFTPAAPRPPPSRSH